MKEAELNPCPFCGGVAELHERYHSIEEAAEKESEIPKDAWLLYAKVFPRKSLYFYKRKTYIPRCTDTTCVGRTTKVFFDKEAAIFAWNRRATDGKAD